MKEPSERENKERMNVCRADSTPAHVFHELIVPDTVEPSGELSTSCFPEVLLLRLSVYDLTPVASDSVDCHLILEYPHQNGECPDWS